MEFLIEREKSEVIKILDNNTLLKKDNSRKSFLTLCGLENYCDLVARKDLFNKLYQNYITLDCERQLCLVVCLKNLIELDDNLTVEEEDILEYIIEKIEMILEFIN